MPANAFASAWLGRAMAMAKKLWFMFMVHVHGAYNMAVAVNDLCCIVVSDVSFKWRGRFSDRFGKDHTNSASVGQLTDADDSSKNPELGRAGSMIQRSEP